jgi:isocitrate/isopropylmalate dehydrogenase
VGLNLAALAGDGAGSAVTTEALNILQAVGGKSDRALNFNGGLIDGAAMDTLGNALSYETLHSCRMCRGQT